ncbi:MAG: cold shock domain-containing protein [Chloroflexi bacterium]|nr:cold shock domain-containing protein [Chloroflexota bacterium]
MQTGKVVRLIRDRGFGFIRLSDGSEVFFHHSAMGPGEFDQLHEGDELEFTVDQDQYGRGTRAANVHHAGAAR